jgi:hypothetical protein
LKLKGEVDMNINKIQSVVICLLIIPFSLFLSCTNYVKLPIVLSLQPNDIDKIPLRAGLYMPKEFKDYTPLVGKIEFHTEIYYKIGEALSNGANEILNKAFRETVILDQEENAASKNVDVVVIPEIDSITAKSFNFATARIKWTIRDLNKKVLYLNTFVGEGKGEGFRGPTIMESAYTHAIEDQFNKAFFGITKNKWWEGIAAR